MSLFSVAELYEATFTNWVDSLPLVLLSIRSTQEDLKRNAAELVYGQHCNHLPGEFFSAGSVSLCEPPAHVAQLKAAMQALRVT